VNHRDEAAEGLAEVAASSSEERTARTLTISDDIARVVLAPECGGAIASFRWGDGDRAIDWLRAAHPAALARGDAGAMGCFPLIPYSNRIRGGRFAFAGATVRLAASPGDPHCLHGHGWRGRWEAERTGRDAAVLKYAHAADDWPWRYEATQRIGLRAGALRVDLSLTNLSDAPMPAGLGLHPYFPATPLTRLEAAVDRMWKTDGEILPTTLVPPARGADPGEGITVAAVELDNAFTGWSGRGRIVWPEQGRALDMLADAPLRFLVVYTPAGAPWFCAEPVSNATDAFNLADAGRPDTGMIVIAPGATARAGVEFVPVPSHHAG